MPGDSVRNAHADVPAEAPYQVKAIVTTTAYPFGLSLADGKVRARRPRAMRAEEVSALIVSTCNCLLKWCAMRIGIVHVDAQGYQ